MRPSLLVQPLLLTACGASELNRLETEQRALEDEVVALRQTLDELRSEMQNRGVIKPGPHGPRAKAAAAAAPNEPLGDAFPFEMTRIDGDRKVQPVGAPERRNDTACGWRVGLNHLEPISDFSLGADALGRSSPVLMTLNGHPLQAHAPPGRTEHACGGAFRHQSKFLFFSPPDDPEGGAGEVALELSAELPLLDETGRPRYWVYPGSTLEVRFPEAWDTEAWGEPALAFDLRLRPVGTAAQPTARGEGAVVVRWLDQEVQGSSASWRDSAPLPADVAELRVTIESPPDGPFVLVEALSVGNAAHAAVVTSKQNPGDAP